LVLFCSTFPNKTSSYHLVSIQNTLTDHKKRAQILGAFLGFVIYSLLLFSIGRHVLWEKGVYWLYEVPHLTSAYLSLNGKGPFLGY
jgi:hypothetical protein